jgi:hypothetical protein
MKKHTKQAQAAMEFLMTYGWALLVVLVAIGALAYFGVFSPQTFLPGQCVFFPGVSCEYVIAYEVPPPPSLFLNLEVHVVNNLGYTMKKFDIRTTIGGVFLNPSSGPNNVKNCQLVNQDIFNDELKKCGFTWLNVAGLNFVEGDTFQADIIFEWDDEFGNRRRRVGQLVVIVGP